ncbi:hypothetical protein V8G54_023089 [Vigna mungo]|uniref:GAG-pre-integrase domain-containing protein n=1 Tax=Vigna mungo TaxID=3915 RepID=A0AAQ3RR84_VIGMU
MTPSIKQFRFGGISRIDFLMPINFGSLIFRIRFLPVNKTYYFRIGFPTGYRKNKPHNKASASLVEIDSAAPIQHLDLDGNPPNDQFTFSKDQYQAILDLLQHTKDYSSSVNQAFKSHFKMIGVARTTNGLYYLEESHDLSCLHTGALWHCRLGHPSKY